MLHFYSSTREITVSKLDQSSQSNQWLTSPKCLIFSCSGGYWKNNNVTSGASFGVLNTSNIFIFPRYISTNQFNDQLSVGLLAQSVSQRALQRYRKGQAWPTKSLIFFGLSVSRRHKLHINYDDDLLCIDFFRRVSFGVVCRLRKLHWADEAEDSEYTD